MGTYNKAGLPRSCWLVLLYAILDALGTYESDKLWRLKPFCDRCRIFNCSGKYDGEDEGEGDDRGRSAAAENIGAGKYSAGKRETISASIFRQRYWEYTNWPMSLGIYLTFIHYCQSPFTA